MQKSVLWGKKIPQISSKFLGTQPPDEGNAKLHGGWRCLPPPAPRIQPSVTSESALGAQCARSVPPGRAHALCGDVGRPAPGSPSNPHPLRPPPSVPTRSVRTDRPFPACFYLSKGRCVSTRPEPRGRGPCGGSGEKRPRKAGDCAQASGLSGPAAGRPNSQGSRHLSAPGRLVLSLFVCLFCYV